jgi:L-fuconolactonase
LIVDAHCHVSDIWYEPVESLLFQMERNAVHCAVLCQILGQFENRYQQACRSKYPGRFASVVAVDPADANAMAQVRDLAQAGAVGLRLRPDAGTGATDPDSLWRAAVEHSLVISVAGSAASITSAEFAARVKKWPQLTLVLEHFAGWARPDCDGQPATRAAILHLARFPNVLLKVPAPGQLNARVAKLPADGRPLDLAPMAIVQEALQHFGSERLMWGSDYPPVSAREGYASALQWSREALAGCSEVELAAIFGGTARRVFRLGKA